MLESPYQGGWNIRLMACMGGMGHTFLDERSKRNRPNERVRLRRIIWKFFLKKNRIRGFGLDSFEKERRNMGEFVKTTMKFVVSTKRRWSLWSPQNDDEACGLHKTTMKFVVSTKRRWSLWSPQNDDEACGLHKTQGISRAAAQLPDFQNRLCSVELVNCKEAIYLECSCAFTTMSWKRDIWLSV